MDEDMEAAEAALVRDESETCPACGSKDLFSGFFDTDDLATTGHGVGDRWTTWCNHCGTEVP